MGLIIFFYGKSQLARPGTAGALLAQTGDLPTKKVISPISCPADLKKLAAHPRTIHMFVSKY